MTNKNLDPVPIIGHQYKFFDDGKICHSRMYDATVNQILTKKEVKKHTLYFPEELYKSVINDNLYDLWKEEINSHINTENFQVLPTKIGEPWLYAEDTDYFVFCEIPEYSDYPVIFVRDIQGKWFSLGYPSSFDGGVLDVTGNLYKSICND